MKKSLIDVNTLFFGLYNDIQRAEDEAQKRGVFDNLSLAEVHTIEAIGMYASKSMSEVAKKLDITMGTLTVSVKNLVAKGYVIRNRSETDRRHVLVSLTKKGRLMYRVHQKFHLDMIKAAIVGLSEYEAEVAKDVLVRINGFINERYRNNRQGEVL
ncbi:MAG: MarR family winged helix-turn-helix transcriptional regulator [Clostridiales bacterium]|nr:MarR family winged helix-turn-helix transcriptional regulator [Clostridiales bacterium]MCD8215285.1 MarR family winged helix-turn-helix transcriptional regulator [Clostridiales bacterium]